MGKLKTLLGCAVAATALVGCVRDAHIAVPAELASSAERIELTGIGGGERGTFRLGASTGSFRRSAGQETWDDGYVRNAGDASFIAEGPELGGALGADCDFSQSEVGTGLVVVPEERFGFRCDFRRGDEPIDAALVLQAAPRSPGRLLSGITRAGELSFEGRRMAIRAIHEMEGGRLPTGTPLGYAFDLGGKQIGAVDLNGSSKTIYAPPSGPEREAVLAASLALSILWDPASSRASA